MCQHSSPSVRQGGSKFPEGLDIHEFLTTWRKQAQDKVSCTWPVEHGRCSLENLGTQGLERWWSEVTWMWHPHRDCCCSNGTFSSSSHLKINNARKKRFCFPSPCEMLKKSTFHLRRTRDECCCPHPAGVQCCRAVIITFFLILIPRQLIILSITSQPLPHQKKNTRGKETRAFGYNVLFWMANREMGVENEKCIYCWFSLLDLTDSICLQPFKPEVEQMFMKSQLISCHLWTD